MEKRWRRVRINPVDFIRDRFGQEVPWIKFDPSVRHEGGAPKVGRRQKQHAHDGTMMFTIDAMMDLLRDLVFKAAYRLDDPPSRHLGETAVYTLGWIRIIQTFPPDGVDLPIGRFPGQRERVSLSYRVDWIKETKARK